VHEILFSQVAFSLEVYGFMADVDISGVVALVVGVALWIGCNRLSNFLKKVSFFFICLVVLACIFLVTFLHVVGAVFFDFSLGAFLELSFLRFFPAVLHYSFGISMVYVILRALFGPNNHQWCGDPDELDYWDSEATPRDSLWWGRGRGQLLEDMRSFGPVRKKSLGSAYALGRKSRAKNILGIAYANGRGVLQDYVKAFYWFQSAARRGYAPAQANLAMMYEYGLGVEKDLAKAVGWYKKAAVRGGHKVKKRLAQLVGNS
jgi:hypothetical protein